LESRKGAPRICFSFLLRKFQLEAYPSREKMPTVFGHGLLEAFRIYDSIVPEWVLSMNLQCNADGVWNIP
jgi:hypothetical protein